MKSKILMYIFFILGISIILYPFFTKIITLSNQTYVISKYENRINVMTEKEKEEIKQKSDKYNQSLQDSTNFSVSLETTENATSYIDFFDIGDTLAVLQIPKLSLNIPIYEGTTDKVLQTGIGHLQNTSMPIGGESTHSVLVGHTGLTEGKMFDDLEQIELGDMFYINYLDNILAYKVNNIQIVLPEETESLRIYANQDLVTLVTCTPKYINTHRLLVTGERTEIQPEDADKITKEIYKHFIENKDSNIYLYIIIAVIIAIFLLLIIKAIRKKKKGADKTKKSKKEGSAL